MEDCLFCNIAAKKIPSSIVFENESYMAFSDISPQAPTHVLIIPKTHIRSTADINETNSKVAGDIVSLAAKIAKDQKLEGYRLVFNSGEIAGQTVFHLHCHLLGGRLMHWPPG